MLSGCAGQVDIPAGQVTFNSHLANEQVVCQLNHQKSKLKLTRDKRNNKTTSVSQGEAGIHKRQVFFESWTLCFSCGDSCLNYQERHARQDSSREEYKVENHETSRFFRRNDRRLKQMTEDLKIA